MAGPYYVRHDGSNASAGNADTAAGAWQTIAYAVRNASNGVVANDDTIYIVADQGNYTENALAPDRGLILRGLRGTAVIDGTGGGAGSDIITPPAGASYLFLYDIKVQNAVDQGVAGTGNYWGGIRVGAQSCGGVGMTVITAYTNKSWGHFYCHARGCASHGFVIQNENNKNLYALCESSDNGGAGFKGGTILAVNSAAYDNVADGFESDATTAGPVILANCTSEGNGGDGADLLITALSYVAILNSAVTNNTGTGITLSGAMVAKAFSDYNNLHGNGADRNNFAAGTNDIASAPGYVNAAGDDLTLDTGSALIGACYSPFKSPMLLNIGATIAEVASPGGGALVNGGLAR